MKTRVSSHWRRIFVFLGLVVFVTLVDLGALSRSSRAESTDGSDPRSRESVDPSHVEYELEVVGYQHYGALESVARHVEGMIERNAKLRKVRISWGRSLYVFDSSVSPREIRESLLQLDPDGHRLRAVRMTGKRFIVELSGS